MLMRGTTLIPLLIGWLLVSSVPAAADQTNREL